MASVNEEINNNITANNWSDNLLIKEQDGALHYFKPGKTVVKSTPELVKVTNQPSSQANINTAPLDDTFSHPEPISGLADSRAEFVFHPDDQKEIETIAQQTINDDSKKYGVEKIVARLMEKHGLQLDEDNKRLFTDAIYNFFRNRKKAIVTRDFLSNKILSKQGKLSPETVDSVLAIIKGLKKEIDEGGGLVVQMSELKPMATVPAKEEEDIPVYELEESDKGKLASDEIKEALAAIDKPAEAEFKAKEVKKQPETPEPKSEISQSPTIEITKPVNPKFELPEATRPVIDQDKVKEEQEPKKEIEPPMIESSLPSVSRPSQRLTDKKQLSDVISTSRPVTVQAPSSSKDVLTGPVKELQFMDLLNFRRLGSTADERAGKILDKINLLEQDSYTKKAQGVAGWRNSPIYKQYLDLGAESMVSGQEISALMEQYKSQGKETLDLEEFSAISDLNQKLRF